MKALEATSMPGCQTLEVLPGIDPTGDFYQALHDSREQLKQQLLEKWCLGISRVWNG